MTRAVVPSQEVQPQGRRVSRWNMHRNIALETLDVKRCHQIFSLVTKSTQVFCILIENWMWRKLDREKSRMRTLISITYPCHVGGESVINMKLGLLSCSTLTGAQWLAVARFSRLGSKGRFSWQSCAHLKTLPSSSFSPSFHQSLFILESPTRFLHTRVVQLQGAGPSPSS